MNDYIVTIRKAEHPLPKNKGILRMLDCAVITYLHDMRVKLDLEPIDTVKGIFIEGDPIYPNAGFNEKTHTQVCVCNPDCIKGVFRVKPDDIQ